MAATPTSNHYFTLFIFALLNSLIVNYIEPVLPNQLVRVVLLRDNLLLDETPLSFDL